MCVFIPKPYIIGEFFVILNNNGSSGNEISNSRISNPLFVKELRYYYLERYSTMN